MTKEEILESNGWMGQYSIHSSTQLQLEYIHKAMQEYSDQNTKELKDKVDGAYDTLEQWENSYKDYEIEISQLKSEVERLKKIKTKTIKL